MIITNSILHILDLHSGIPYLSGEELSSEDIPILEYISKHAEKHYHSTSAKRGFFNEDSDFKALLQQFNNNELDFIDLSRFIGEKLFENYSISDDLYAKDVLVCRFNYEDEAVLGILVFSNQVEFTHKVENSGGIISNQIIKHYAILPGANQRVSTYAFINLRDFTILFSDKPVSINGEDTVILSEKLLCCSTKLSQSDAIKIVQNTSKIVADDFGKNPTAVIAKAKKYIMENAEVSEFIEPEEFAKEVFAESVNMQHDFIEKATNSGFTESVKIDSGYAVKRAKSHKIKTDTGIELTIPYEYFQNNDFIEFVNNADGTISIQLKNINKIDNK